VSLFFSGLVLLSYGELSGDYSVKFQIHAHWFVAVW